MEYLVKSVEQTFQIAKTLAKSLKGGETILLNGDLGAGKTTFTKGLAKALDIDDVITSPTFMFMKEYKGRLNLYHFDLYRAEEEDELYELGLNEYFEDKKGVCVVEWNKFTFIKNPIVINIEVIDENTRKFVINESINN